MPITFEVERFQKAVESMVVRVKAKERKAILAGAKIIQGEIIKLAPERTGNLKRNIIISEFKQDGDGGEYVEVGPEKKKAFYGAMLEFGTTKMKPRAFVEPAFISKRKEALEAMGEVMKGAIESNV